jgi:anti-anti-sigma factor
MILSSRSEHGIGILQVHGSITLGPHLRSFHARAERMLKEPGCAGLVLNFASVSALDSAGIGELVMIHSAAARRGVRVVVVKASPRIRELLVITRVDGLLAFADDESSAIRGLR